MHRIKANAQPHKVTEAATAAGMTVGSQVRGTVQECFTAMRDPTGKPAGPGGELFSSRVRFCRADQIRILQALHPGTGEEISPDTPVFIDGLEGGPEGYFELANVLITVTEAGITITFDEHSSFRPTTDEEPEALDQLPTDTAEEEETAKWQDPVGTEDREAVLV